MARDCRSGQILRQTVEIFRIMRHVGFYWTRPVFWAGFRQLDPSPEIAAGQSRTIRYQRALVRQWAGRVGAEIVEEVVAMEIAPDRASPALLGDLERALGIAAQKAARLVLVDFADAHGWRRHGPLWDRLAREDHALISPEPLDLEGAVFDPVEHFRSWRRTCDAHIATRPEHRALILAALQDLETLALPAQAEALNRAGFRTFTGRTWTADNLRKFVRITG